RTLVPALVLLVALAWVAYAGAIAWHQRGLGSDIVRQWVVGRYLLAGRNPWALSEAILVERYGEGNPDRVYISAIPRDVPADLADEVLPDVGPPEATYPPPAVGLLELGLGWVPSPWAVLALWLAVNALALLAVAVLLTRWFVVPLWLPG